MPRVKSAKGKVVDFDLLKIKRQMANTPISIDVKARQNFIDQKARRRLRKVTKVATAATIKVDADTLAGVVPSAAKPLVDVTPAKQTQVVDVSAVVVPSEEKSSKQKIRPPKSE